MLSCKIEYTINDRDDDERMSFVDYPRLDYETKVMRSHSKRIYNLLSVFKSYRKKAEKKVPINRHDIPSSGRKF